MSGRQTKKTILAVYFEPDGEGPFPVVVILHGTEGLRETHVKLARDLAGSGFIGVAGAWFEGHFRGVATTIPITHSDDIKSSGGPKIKAGNSAAAAADVAALIAAARTLPKADADRVAVFGHSRGSATALTAAATTADVRAVIAAAGYPSGVDFQGLEAAVLLVQGRSDAVIPPTQALRFQESLAALGKSAELVFIDGGPHESPWRTPWSLEVYRHVLEFLSRQLG